MLARNPAAPDGRTRTVVADLFERTTDDRFVSADGDLHTRRPRSRMPA